MRLAKASSFEELQIISRYEGLRTVLLDRACSDHIDKPLAIWALPTDRRLPLAFLGAFAARPAGDPLCGAVGHTRHRAEEDSLLCEPPGPGGPIRAGRAAGGGTRAGGAARPAPAGGNGAAGGSPFDPGQRVGGGGPAGGCRRAAGVGSRTAGPLRPQLAEHDSRDLEHAAGSLYGHTLGEIRVMKTHGEKRVRAILEVFHSLHVVIANMGLREHLTVNIVPRLIEQVEQWTGHVLQTPGTPSQEEISRTSSVRSWSRSAATPRSKSPPWRSTDWAFLSRSAACDRPPARWDSTRRSRLSTAQRDQRHHDVRWPLGRHQVYELRDKLLAGTSAGLELPPPLAQFGAVVELSSASGTRRLARLAPWNTPPGYVLAAGLDDDDDEPLLAPDRESDLLVGERG